MRQVYDFRDDLASVDEGDQVQLDVAVCAHANRATEQHGVIVDVRPDAFTVQLDGGGTASWPPLGSLLAYRRGRRCTLLLAEPDVLGFGPQDRLRYVTLEHVLEIWVETHGLTPARGAP